MSPAGWRAPAAVRRRGRDGSPPAVSIEGADQVLRPPQDGLRHLRGEQLAAQTLDPGELALRDGTIRELAADPLAELTVDATGWTVLPGLIDCHTHLPFAGWRAGEYEQKLAGVPYEQIARSGGGIRASAQALRETPDELVLDQATGLAAEMLATGTTTFEAKSGYGLSREGEIRSLRLARELEIHVAQTTTSTALLAHAVPDGYDADAWMGEVAAMMPEVIAAGSVTALDIFVESIAFDNDHLRQMGAMAAAGGLHLRCHVEQFGGLRSVPVALEVGARSVDHLSTLHPQDIAPLAQAPCAAVLLPAAEFLGAEHRAPGRALLDAGAIVVVASDGNPGTAPVFSMPVVLGLAARLYGFSTRELLGAATLNAAWTLGLEHDRGSIEPGKRADLVLLDGPAQALAYRFARNPVAVVLVAGEPVWIRDEAAAARLHWSA
jgi:imidazolonepropionase